MDRLAEPLNELAATASFDAVEAICRAFADEAGQSHPSIESYLRRVSDTAQPTLLRNLLDLDIRRRRSAGQTPQADDYLARLPQFGDVIRRAFADASQVSQATRSIAEGVASTRDAPKRKLTLLARHLGEYELLRELGRGGMGVVYEAVHVRRGDRVALKVLPAVEAASLHRFKREFRSLADVNHPNLIGLGTLEADGCHWFFTMDLIEGTDFLSYVRPPEGALDVQRLRAALAQLVAAVMALHDRQIIHRDLKPSNVLVTQDGRVVVLDFGLVLESEATEGEATTGQIEGTPRYMAPEQAAGERVSTAADWYAVGVMLYEALAGRPPFEGQARQLLYDKQRFDAPPLPAAAGLPEDLVQLAMRLLTRDPLARPDDRGLEEVAVRHAPNLGAIAPTGSVPRGLLRGRERQIREIEGAIRTFEADEGARIIFISGKSGEGKTVLAEQFLQQFRRDSGYTVLAGRCYDRESVPFKAIDSLIDALGNRLKAMSQAEIRGLLTPEAAVLANLFPVLGRVPQIARLPRVSLENLELDRVRRLAADALRDVLGRLSRSTRLVCFIDDLQWGDAGSAELLLDVLRPPSPKLLLLATYRSDEAASSRFLQSWNRGNQAGQDAMHTECRLNPLDPEECLRLVLDIVGIDTEAVRQRASEMAEETHGNPFLLSELASCYDPDAEASRPTQMEEVVERKLASLPGDARNLLDVVSISGRAVLLDEAARTAGHESVPISTITRMRTERLLRMVGDQDEMSIDTYHDRIRETVLRDMGADRRKTLHVKLAETIEASLGGTRASGQPAQETLAADEQPTARVYDLAYHYFEGADPRAFGYQFQAGEAAMRAYAMENAIEHLQKAEQVLPETADRPTRYRLWERLGQACGKAQRFSAALKYYQIAGPFAGSTIEQAVVYDGIGEAHHRLGDFGAALSSFDQALDAVGFHRPNWLPRVLAEMCWITARCEFEGLVWPSRTGEARAKARLASDVLHRVHQIFLTQGDVVRIADAVARVAFAALRSGDPGAITVAFALLAYLSGMSSLHGRATRLLSRATRAAQQCNDGPAKALLEGFGGGAAYCHGDLETAERGMLRALEVINPLGESWYRMGYYHLLRHLYAVRGHSDKEIAAAEMECRIAEAVSDPETMSWGQYGMANAKARIGLLPEAHEHMKCAFDALASRKSKLAEAVAFNHLGFVRLQSSDYPKAVVAYETSIRIYEKARAYLEFAVGSYPGLIEALLGPDWAHPRHDGDVRRAKRLSLKSLFFGWRFPNIRLHSWRAHGRLCCALGRPQKAERYLRKSVESARQLGAEYPLARCLLDLSIVAKEDGQALRTEGVGILKRIHAVIPRAEKWQLAKNYDESCVAPAGEMPSIEAIARWGA